MRIFNTSGNISLGLFKTIFDKVKPEGIPFSKAINGLMSNEKGLIFIFKVQLSASSKKLELTPSNFKGLRNISMSGDTNLYRYMYGETASYDEAKQLLQEAKSKGFTSAFLIAFKNGKKIDVKDAIKQ